MAEEEKQKNRAIKTTSIVAAGCASVVAALFTSRLGVAGTLIGTALTSMVITLISAILNAQLEKASTKISSLPSSVRGRLSTQQVQTPGSPNAEPDPGPSEESPSEESRPEPPRGERRRDQHSAGFLERLRSIPDRLRAMSPNTRRRVLVSGTLAGVVATAIGLSIITLTEAAAGQNLYSLVWSRADTASAGATTDSRPSIVSAFDRSRGADDQQYAPSGGGQETPSGDGQGTPSGGGQQYEQEPAVGGGDGGQQEVPAEPVPQDPPEQDAPVQPQAVPGEQEQPALPSGQ